MKKILLSLIPFIVLLALGYGGYKYKEYSDFYSNLKPLATASSTKAFTLTEVAGHGTKDSCYTTINSNVYNLTSWVDKHPGGAQRILNICGKDGTATFTKKHGNSENAKTILDGFKIGTLAN
jgi:cytochrome b involved in lipid metabolism